MPLAGVNPSSLWRWSALSVAMLLLVVVPFLLYEQRITAWTEAFIARETSLWWIAAGLGGLLASDIVLPVPSSLVATAAGYLLGIGAGTLVSWSGMTVGSLIGYGLGRRLGQPFARRWVGEEELQRVSRAERRFGDRVVIVFRAVPVLAEASVVFAGLASMPPRRFVLLMSLSNLGIAVTYSAVGAYALEMNSFLLAFAGAILVPALALLLVRRQGQ